MNALIGIAHGRGLLDLDATLEDLDVDDIEPLSPGERSATLRHLLLGRSGIYHPAASQGSEVRAFPPRHHDAPGERWSYNNWDFNVLGTILTRASGLNPYAAFDHWVARPLGMEDFDPAVCADRLDPVSAHAAYKFRMSLRDLSRFGLLYARRGRWRDRQVIPEDWVRTSTQPWTPDTGYPFGGFGYLWWVGPTADLGGRAHFSAHGGSAQALVIVPELEVVVSHANRDLPGDGGAGDAPRWQEVAPLIAEVLDLGERLVAIAAHPA